MEMTEVRARARALVDSPALTYRQRVQALAGLAEETLDPPAVDPDVADALRTTYEKMIRVGGERFSVKPGRMPDFDALEDELPNFSEVLVDLRKQLALCMETDDPLEIAPDKLKDVRIWGTVQGGRLFPANGV